MDQYMGFCVHSGTIYLKFGLSLHLHVYCVYASFVGFRSHTLVEIDHMNPFQETLDPPLHFKFVIEFVITSDCGCKGNNCSKTFNEAQNVVKINTSALIDTHFLHTPTLGGGNLGVILVRVCGQVFLKPTPIIYLVFENKK